MNQVNYLELEKISKELNKSAEDVRNSLNQMDTMICEAIGIDGYAWSGEGAISFRNSWDILADSIPEYVSIVETQVNNVLLMTKKMNEVDDNI